MHISRRLRFDSKKGEKIMIKKVSIFILILFFTVIGLSGMADAKLIKIGMVTINNTGGAPTSGGGMPGDAAPTGMPGGAKEYGLIYDDDQGLVWLDYTNQQGSWPSQMNWVAGLNISGVMTYKLDSGVSVSWDGDWRLPKTVDGGRTFGYDGTTTAGFNITTSEMGYLFYKSLGNVGYYDSKGNQGSGWYPDSTWGLKNKGPFTNLKSGIYWSGTEYALLNTHAWAFSTAFGEQSSNSFKGSYPYMAIAVRQAKVIFGSGQ
jgi:hypothetical protein